MRSAVGQATTAANTAGSTAAGYGSGASSISSTLQPFLEQELTHPQGYSQADMTQQLNQAQAGAGGATAGVTGQANLMTARTRNPSGFTGALDEAARERTKAAAGAAEGVAANNAGLKVQQQQDGANGLSSMYGQDTDAMLKSMGLQTGDINAEVNADNSGWLQNMNQTLASIRGGGVQRSGGGGFTI